PPACASVSVSLHAFVAWVGSDALDSEASSLGWVMVAVVKRAACHIATFKDLGFVSMDLVVGQRVVRDPAKRAISRSRRVATTVSARGHGECTAEVVSDPPGSAKPAGWARPRARDECYGAPCANLRGFRVAHAIVDRPSAVRAPMAPFRASRAT